MLKFLVAAYLTKPRLPPRDGYEEQLKFVVGLVIVDMIFKVNQCRSFFGNQDELCLCIPITVRIRWFFLAESW